MTARAIDLAILPGYARYRGRRFPCAVGRGGIGLKRAEGDGLTPTGTWRIGEVWYRPDRVAAPRFAGPLRRIGPRDIWSDDPRDPAYNLAGRAPDHPFSHEYLRRADPLYDMIAVLDYNWPLATPGMGSAIFLHVWRKPRHPTAGCIAFAPDVLRRILETWQPDARVVVSAA